MRRAGISRSPGFDGGGGQSQPRTLERLTRDPAPSRQGSAGASDPKASDTIIVYVEVDEVTDGQFLLERASMKLFAVTYMELMQRDCELKLLGVNGVKTDKLDTRDLSSDDALARLIDAARSGVIRRAPLVVDRRSVLETWERIYGKTQPPPAAYLKANPAPVDQVAELQKWQALEVIPDDLRPPAGPSSAGLDGTAPPVEVYTRRPPTAEEMADYLRFLQVMGELTPGERELVRLELDEGIRRDGESEQYYQDIRARAEASVGSMKDDIERRKKVMAPFHRFVTDDRAGNRTNAANIMHRLMSLRAKEGTGPRDFNEIWKEIDEQHGLGAPPSKVSPNEDFLKGDTVASQTGFGTWANFERQVAALMKEIEDRACKLALDLLANIAAKAGDVRGRYAKLAANDGIFTSVAELGQKRVSWVKVDPATNAGQTMSPISMTEYELGYNDLAANAPILRFPGIQGAIMGTRESPLRTPEDVRGAILMRLEASEKSARDAHRKLSAKRGLVLRFAVVVRRAMEQLDIRAGSALHRLIAFEIACLQYHEEASAWSHLAAQILSTANVLFLPAVMLGGGSVLLSRATILVAGAGIVDAGLRGWEDHVLKSAAEDPALEVDFGLNTISGDEVALTKLLSFALEFADPAVRGELRKALTTALRAGGKIPARLWRTLQLKGLTLEAAKRVHRGLIGAVRRVTAERELVRSADRLALTGGPSPIGASPPGAVRITAQQAAERAKSTFMSQYRRFVRAEVRALRTGDIADSAQVEEKLAKAWRNYLHSADEAKNPVARGLKEEMDAIYAKELADIGVPSRTAQSLTSDLESSAALPDHWTYSRKRLENAARKGGFTVEGNISQQTGLGGLKKANAKVEKARAELARAAADKKEAAIEALRVAQKERDGALSLATSYFQPTAVREVAAVREGLEIAAREASGLRGGVVKVNLDKGARDLVKERFQGHLLAEVRALSSEQIKALEGVALEQIFSPEGLKQLRGGLNDDVIRDLWNKYRLNKELPNSDVIVEVATKAGERQYHIVEAKGITLDGTLGVKDAGSVLTASAQSPVVVTILGRERCKSMTLVVPHALGSEWRLVNGQLEHATLAADGSRIWAKWEHHLPQPRVVMVVDGRYKLNRR